MNKISFGQNLGMRYHCNCFKKHARYFLWLSFSSSVLFWHKQSVISFLNALVFCTLLIGTLTRLYNFLVSFVHIKLINFSIFMEAWNLNKCYYFCPWDYLMCILHIFKTTWNPFEVIPEWNVSVNNIPIKYFTYNLCAVVIYFAIYCWRLCFWCLY